VFKQFLLVIFFIVQSSNIFAAVPDISGTYTGTEAGTDICSDETDSWQELMPDFIIIQTGSFFTVVINATEGNNEYSSMNLSGSVDKSGSLIGDYTSTYNSDNGDYDTGSGTFNGRFNTSNNQLLISLTGSYTEFNANGSYHDTCRFTGNYVLTRTSEPPAVEPPTAENDPKGQVVILTPVDAEAPTDSGTIPDVTAVITLENSSSTINRADDSIIEIQPKTIVTLNPVIETTNTNTLVRGEITTTVDCTKTNDYEVRTALADIKVHGSCSTVRRIDSNAKFTTNYSQNGLDATLKVSVISGTVEVNDREGNMFILNAGDEKIIQKRVPRTQWVLPIDEDKLYGGKDNFLIWTQFPDATSYQMEFNLPTPDFAEQNASVPQFTKQVIPLTAYTEFEGLALLTLPLPKGADGLVLELRIFALDADGNIIGESVSSDSSSVTLAD